MGPVYEVAVIGDYFWNEDIGEAGDREPTSRTRKMRTLMKPMTRQW